MADALMRFNQKLWRNGGGYEMRYSKCKVQMKGKFFENRNMFLLK